MVNLARLRASGLTEEKLKAYFQADHQLTGKAKDLVQMLRDCIKSGVDRNLRDYRIYWAIDRSMDTAFYQASYTQLQGLIEGGNDQNKVMEMANRWGLTHLLPDAIDPVTGQTCCDAAGKAVKALNIPVFFNIFIPLVSAYVTIRWAKLFNDRNLTPLYKYEPAKFTKLNRIRCEIITELMQVLSTNYNYKDDERQAILQTLLYAICIKMPREAWHTVKQEDASGKAIVVKEGLRFHMPHPSRLFHDQFYRPSTINSDTGCRYMGYWEICPYKDLKGNPNYWNTDRITYGVNTWFASAAASDFFATVYHPCVLQFPPTNSGLSATSSTAGAGELDRENEAAYYGTEQSGMATLKTEIFYKLIPKEWDLGDYEYPVWFRFVMANDTAVLWAEPVPYCPGAFYGYDYDGNRHRNKSLALEVLPFQDLISQTFSQWIMSVRQNLINPVFVNEDLVPQEIVSKLENLGERLIRGRVFIPYSKTENIQLGDDEREAFHSPPLTRHNTAEIAILVKGILDILDRVLVLSSQEIGQSAPHEQTAEEVRRISTTTSTRLDFTGSFIDDGVYATKKMLYDAYMAHGDDDFKASISQGYARTEEEFQKILKDLGIDLEKDVKDSAADGKRLVTGTKKAIELVNFSSTRDAADRVDSPAVAAAMGQLFNVVANNPLLVQSVGAEQLIDLLNLVISVAGLPKEFKLRPVNKALPPEQQGEELKSQLVEFSKQVKDAIDKSAAETAQAVLSQTTKAIQPIGEAVQTLSQENEAQSGQIHELQAAMAKIAQMLASLPPPQPPPPPPPPQFLTPPQNEIPNDAAIGPGFLPVEEPVGLA